MKIQLKSSLAIIAVCPLLVVSCAQDSMTGDTYSRYEAGHAQSVKTGRITSIQNVNIQAGNNAGKIIGGIAGGFLGHNIGSGTAANTAGAIGGALVGSAVGSHLEQGIGSRPGLNIIVKLDGGGSISVVQEYSRNEYFKIGDRVKVFYNGDKTRVTH